MNFVTHFEIRIQLYNLFLLKIVSNEKFYYKQGNLFSFQTDFQNFGQKKQSFTAPSIKSFNFGTTKKAQFASIHDDVFHQVG